MLTRRKQGMGKTARGENIVFGTKGEPDITGTWRRVYQVRRIMNPNSFQPYDHMVDVVVGQAIAIEVKTGDAKLSRFQEAWKDAFMERGGLFIEARSLDDVERAIGASGERLA